MADNKNSAQKLIYESQESLYEQAVKTMNADQLIVQFAFKVENYLKAAEMFDEVGDYQDAVQLAEQCRNLAVQAEKEEKEYNYQLAVNQKELAISAKGYEKAEKLFQAVPGYKDTEQQLKECREKREQLEQKMRVKKTGRFCLIAVIVIAVIAFFMSPVWENIKIQILGEEKLEDPRTAVVKTEVAETETMEVVLKNAQSGDQISFGEFEWCVLETNETQVKLIMLHAEKYEELRHTPYHETLEDVTWESCSLRKWLNSDFLENHFTEEEQKKILTVEIENEDNSTYGTLGGNTTEDQVFLLSAAEVAPYKDALKSIRMNMWLRSPGNSQDTAAFMASTNVAMDYGYPVTGTDFYTCPVICVVKD